MTKQPPAEKLRPYEAPVLKQYGNLHTITRGSTNMGNDGGGGMTGVTMTMGMGGGMGMGMGM